MGAYADLLAVGHDALFVQWVVDRESGKSEFLVYQETEEIREAWRHVYEIWCWSNRYDPREETT